MPKSSTAISIPASRRSDSCRDANSRSRARSVSVISITRRRGSRPASATICSVDWANASSPSSRAETLTEIHGALGASAQRAAWAVAVRRTHWSISVMSPASVAIGRNAPGSSSPRSGCIQRMSASKPTVVPVATSTTG